MTNPPTQDVFKLVLARPVLTESGRESALVHLWWSAPQQGDRLVQVYVNGRLCDTTTDPDQRELWLVLDRAATHRVELLAVPANNPDTPDAPASEHPTALNTWSPPVAAEASLAVLRDGALPIDTQLAVALDDETEPDRGELWPPSEHRAGFGSLFGVSAFGFDDATGPGLGRGQLGWGTLGAGGTLWRWRRDALDPGTHEITVTTTDATGQTLAPDAVIPDLVIDRLPDPAQTLTIDPDFTLHWNPTP